MKSLAIICALAFTPTLLMGGDKTFVGNPGKEGYRFTDPANWDTNTLPEKGDIVRVNHRFGIDAGDNSMIEMDSLEAGEFPGQINGGEFLVHNAIQARGMSLGPRAKRFEWGGEFELTGLTIWAALSTDQTTKFFGGDLTFTNPGGLLFVFHTKLPNGLPDNDQPILELKGKLDFRDDSKVMIEGKGMDINLPSGDYLLVKAKEISMTPQLEFIGFPDAPKEADLRIEDGKLILRIP